jgi:hypothetical protein
MYRNAGGFNDLGFSQALPDGAIAPQYQYASDAINALRNQRLGEEASDILYGGLEQLGRYRPGGLAQMSSGMYQGLANTTLAMRRDSPDLMYWARRDEARKARSRQRKSRLTTGAGMLGAAALSMIPGMQPFAIPLMMAAGAATSMLGGDGGAVASTGIAASNAGRAAGGQPQGQNAQAQVNAIQGAAPPPNVGEMSQAMSGGPQLQGGEPGAGNIGTPEGGPTGGSMQGGGPQGGGGIQGGGGGMAGGGQAAAQGVPAIQPNTMQELAAANIAASTGGAHPYQVLAEALVADPDLDDSWFYDEIDFTVNDVASYVFDV